MCTQYLHHIQPLISSSPSHWYQSPSQDLFSDFVKEKKRFFFFYLRSYTGSFLVALRCIYVLYPKLVHLLYFSLVYYSPFLIRVSTGLKILYSFLYREYISHSHLLNFLFYPPPLVHDLALAWSVFHSTAEFVLGLYSTYERKHAAFGLLSLANFT
jgi:hypothetical protein